MLKNIGDDVFKIVTDGFFDKQERMQRDMAHEKVKAEESQKQSAVKNVAGNFGRGVMNQVRGNGRRRGYPEEDVKSVLKADGPEFG